MEVHTTVGINFRLRRCVFIAFGLAVLAPTQAQFTACTTRGNYTDDIFREVPIKNARTSVTISSPNFPQPYPQNIQCTWRVIAPSSYQVKLSFLTFELEPSHRPSGCHDYVTVRQGGQEFIEAKEMRTHCDSTKPRDVQSDGEILWVRFITDTEIQKKGFTIKVIPASGSLSKRYIVLGILITLFVLIIIAIIWCRKRFHRKQKDEESPQVHHYKELCIPSETDRDVQTDPENTDDPEKHEGVLKSPKMRSPTRDTSSGVVLHLRALKSSEAPAYCSLSEDGRSFKDENHRSSGETTQKKPNEQDHLECTELLTIV